MFKKRPIYIFDLDGTLALIDHRRHLVERAQVVCDNCGDEGCIHCRYTGYMPDPEFKPNWQAFYAACVHDKPNQPIIDLFNALMSAGADCRIWSGRSDEVRRETVAWLQANLSLMHWLDIDSFLTMRRKDDFTHDEQLKRKWLHELSDGERARLVMVFDDRKRVVNMWREEGVACAQVAEVEF